MDNLERVARALCSKHYAERFKAPADDPHVLMNVDANWNIFADDAQAAIEAHESTLQTQNEELRAAASAIVENLVGNDRLPDHEHVLVSLGELRAIAAALTPQADS